MKLIIFVFGLLSFGFGAIAQSNNLSKASDTTHHVTVIYNFLSKNDPLQILRLGKGDKKGDTTKVWKDVRKIYFGDKVNFKICVNPFLYDVKVNGTNVSDNSGFDTSVANRFNNFFSSKSATAAKNAIKDSAHTANEPPKVQNAPKEINASSLIDQREVKRILNITALNINLSKQKWQDSAMRSYSNYMTDVKRLSSAIDSFIEKYAGEKNMLGKVLALSFADFKSCDSIQAEITRYLQYMQPNTPNFTIDSLKNSTDYFLHYYQNLISSTKNGMDERFGELKKINRLYGVNTFSDDSLFYEEHASRAKVIMNEDIFGLGGAYTVFLQNLTNCDLWTKSYFPKFAESDSFRFQISIHPSARARGLIGLYNLDLRDTVMEPYTLPVKRFLKLNFSTGLAFLFGGAVPHTYYYSTPKDQLKDSDMVSVVKGRRQAVLVPRISIYTHLYLTNGNWGKSSLTFGISTNPADPSETAYLLGASLIMGQNRRMVVTLGTALANINQLKAKYKTDDPHMKKFYTGVEETDLVEKRLALGAFFGISYNF